ncbi:MAG: ACT domain-containing protein, partial [Acidobacteria bacterium]|nr:ACT domain-containing protein [Acidobacteriota bacterium]
IAGRVFAALGESGVNVVAISQGSSELNISLIVTENQSATAVRAIHQTFRLDLPSQP